jgi:hypothetical protein
MKFRKDLPDSGGKNFVKLKDKESISGIFMGDTHEFFCLWQDGKYKEVPEGTAGASFRFRINFVVKEGTVYVPKILEQGKTVYQQLSELHDEYNLENVVIKITRSGTTKNDTTYTLLPLRQEISEETKAYLKTVKLNELVQKSSFDTDPGPVPPGFDDEIPF